MNRLVLFFTCLMLSTGIFAQEQLMADGKVFKTTDDSPAAQLCIAALESRESLRETARDLGMNRKEQKQVSCNGMSLVEFAKAHRDDIRDWAIATVQ